MTALQTQRLLPPVLGWVLLVSGLLLACWRLDVRYLHAAKGLAMYPSVPVRPIHLAAHHAPPAASFPRQAIPPAGVPLRISGVPSLEGKLVDRILAAYGSPLQGHGNEIAALSARYRIDDAVALAFFIMESRAGTQGEATLTRNVGNLRPMPDAPALDGYRLYQSWMMGVTEWFQVMHTLYLDQLKLATIEEVVPVYAPASDDNDPATMIAGIHQLVACWRGAIDRCPAEPATVHALVAAAIPQPEHRRQMRRSDTPAYFRRLADSQSRPE